MKPVPVAFALILIAGAASAADLPGTPAPLPAPWTWTGLYVGGQIGGGLGAAQFPDPNGTSLYGGNVKTPAALFGAQAGINWQIPNSQIVLGAEADVSALNGDWTNTCLASSGFFISANCRVHQHGTGSFTGRVGLDTTISGRTLLYAKGGIAWLYQAIDITTNGLFPPPTTASSGARWGWTVGAGAEKALTPAWSLRLEYNYANFGTQDMATPASFVQVTPPVNSYAPTPGSTIGVSQTVQTVKVGVNLKLGEDPYSRWAPSATEYRLRGISADESEVEIGARAWYSSGRFQKDLGGTADPGLQNLLVSRLTYATTSASGELFGRVDTASNVFVKGFIGGGKHLSGRMNDEDWVIFGATVPYSNTLSDPVKGDLGYATFDAGYSLFRGPRSKVGAFVGYNYFRDNKSAYGCAQIANPNSACVPTIPNSVLAITEDNTWHSFRVGLSGVIKVTDQFTLTADAAYLPYVVFRGVDNHVLRTDVPDTKSPEVANGQGVQLESVLSYAISPSFSVGAGGRYWAMWATNDAYTNIFGTPCPCQTLPVRTERYGGFLQASYKFEAER